MTIAATRPTLPTLLHFFSVGSEKELKEADDRSVVCCL